MEWVVFPSVQKFLINYLSLLGSHSSSFIQEIINHKSKQLPNLQINYTQSMTDKTKAKKKLGDRMNKTEFFTPKTSNFKQQDEESQKIFLDICIAGGDQQDKLKNNPIGLFVQSFGKKLNFNCKSANFRPNLCLSYQLSKYSKRKIMYGGYQIILNICHFITNQQLMFSFDSQLQFIAKNNNEVIILFSHYESIQKAKLFRDFLEKLVEQKKKLGLSSKLKGLIVLEIPNSSSIFHRENICRRSRNQFMKVAEYFQIFYIEFKQSQQVETKYNDIIKLIGLQKIKFEKKGQKCQNFDLMTKKCNQYKKIYEKPRQRIEEGIWRYIQIRQASKSIFGQIKRQKQIILEPINRIYKVKTRVLQKIGNMFKISDLSPQQSDYNHSKIVQTIHQKIRQEEQQSFKWLNNVSILNLLQTGQSNSKDSKVQENINFEEETRKEDKVSEIRLKYFQEMKESLCSFTQLHPIISKKINEIKSIPIKEWKKLIQFIQLIQQDLNTEIDTLEALFGDQNIILNRDREIQMGTTTELFNKIEEQIKNSGEDKKYLGILSLLKEIRSQFPLVMLYSNQDILWQLKIQKQSMKAKIQTIKDLLDIKIKIIRQIGRGKQVICEQEKGFLYEMLSDYFINSEFSSQENKAKGLKDKNKRQGQRQTVMKKQKFMQTRVLIEKIQNEFNNIQRYYSKFYKFLILSHNLKVLDFHDQEFPKS